MKNFLKTLFQVKPSVGDRVRMAVGFSTYEHEGVVAQVAKNKDGGKYCWIDQFDRQGKCLKSFTASFVYARFTYV